MSKPRPLDGTIVLDLSRLLPGAVLARNLLDLGARLLKIEAPRQGDPLRYAGPKVGDVGVGFSVFFRGAESVELDLRTQAGADALRRLANHADVVVESFRPGTLERWGLAPESLRQQNPRLTVCSLPGFPAEGQYETSVGHDLNFLALSGLLARLGSSVVPGVQLVDVTTGLLACSAIVAALLERTRTGAGCIVTQPMMAAPLPFLLWTWADDASGQPSSTDTLLAGRCPAYRLYRCADGERLALGCLEPKFWIAFCQAVGAPELAPFGLDVGEAGDRAATAMAAHLEGEAIHHWLACVADKDLPVTPVRALSQARTDAAFTAGPLLERTPMPDGSGLMAPGPAIVSVGATPRRPAPKLGQHTRSALLGFGFDEEEILGLN